MVTLVRWGLALNEITIGVVFAYVHPLVQYLCVAVYWNFSEIVLSMKLVVMNFAYLQQVAHVRGTVMVLSSWAMPYKVNK